MLTIYPACFYKEENGYSVVFPDLNALSTCGETLEEAMAMAVDCLAGYVYTSGEDNLPKPSALGSIDPVAYSKEQFGDTPSKCFANLVSVDADAYAKKHFEKSVHRTVTLPLWLDNAGKVAKLNFSRVLQDALREKLQA